MPRYVTHASGDNGVTSGEDEGFVDLTTELDPADHFLEVEQPIVERRTGLGGLGDTTVRSKAVLEATSQIVDRVGHCLGR